MDYENLTLRNEGASVEKGGKISQIEKEGRLDLNTRLGLVLLELGRKEVFAISSKAIPGNKSEELSRAAEKSARYAEICQSLGFAVHSSVGRSLALGSSVAYEVEVAKEKASLGKLQEAIEANDIGSMGKLFGYPRTAVRWYVENMTDGRKREEMNEFTRVNSEKMSAKELQRALYERYPHLREIPEFEEAVKHEKLEAFVSFRPSPDHWREELQNLRRTRDVVKTRAPILYEEIMGQQPKGPSRGLLGKIGS